MIFFLLSVAVFNGHQNSTFYVKSSISPDDQFLVSGSSDEAAYIWKVSYQILAFLYQMFSKNCFLPLTTAKTSLWLWQNISHFHGTLLRNRNPYPPADLQIMRKLRIQKTGKTLKYFVLLLRKTCYTALLPCVCRLIKFCVNLVQ